MKETDQDYGGFVAWFIILPVCVIASLFRKIFR
jgi:cbb3-type cytochrome oxidase subunit 3